MKYYLWVHEAQRGPFSIDELREMFIQKIITNIVLCAPEVGATSWQPIEKVCPQALEEAVPAAGAQPAAAPAENPGLQEVPTPAPPPPTTSQRIRVPAAIAHDPLVSKTQHMLRPEPKQQLIITDIQMPFESMVLLGLKWTAAFFPSLLVLLLLLGGIWKVLGVVILDVFFSQHK
jgi:hypothetical protein